MKSPKILVHARKRPWTGISTVDVVVAGVAGDRPLKAKPQIKINFRGC